MTNIISRITGTTNLLTNSIAAIGLTSVMCLIFAFAIMALSYGIKAF